MTLSDLGLRLFRVGRFGLRELRAWRALSRTQGIREALVQRLKGHLRIRAVDDAAVARLVESFDSLARAASAQAASLQLEVAARERAERELAELKQAQAALSVEVAMGQVAAKGLESLTRRVERQEDLSVRWLWNAYVPPAASNTLVSVILATRNRGGLLPRAIDSVLAQDHAAWELIVVNDGSDDETSQVVRRYQDPRIHLIDVRPRGVSAARNHGLREARGEVVAYLDDDNRMGFGWLRAVAQELSQHAQVDVVYGARIVEADTLRGPYLHFEPYDRARLEQDNFIDLGVLAHRRGLPEAHFDESLAACVDWDLVLRLTRHKAPLGLPVLASVYFRTAPHRISARARAEEAVQRVRERHQRSG